MAKAQSDFAALKKNRSGSQEKLSNELEKLNQKGPEKDPSYWSPTIDKAGNGYAIIRFLPAPPGEEVPFQKLFSHAFKDKGGWYIENSLTTLGQDDPASESNRELWATDTEENKKIVRARKRKLSFISNILVVKDAANPDAEGVVFRYKYGKKIMDMVTDAMAGLPDEDIKGFNPFDMWEGANFRLRVRKIDNFPNYDKSDFDKQAPLASDDAEIEAIWRKTHPLLTEVAPGKFKSYDELKKRFERAIGLGKPAAPRGPEESAPAAKSTPAPRKVGDVHEEGDGFNGDAADEADLARFRQMAAE